MDGKNIFQILLNRVFILVQKLQSHVRIWNRKIANLVTLGIIARYLRVKLGFDGFVNFNGKLILQNLLVFAKD